MKNQVNKIISIALAFIIAFSVCITNFTAFAQPVYKEYYISSSGINVARGSRPATAGTKENPVQSFADVTFLLEQDNLSENDVAKVYFTSGQTMGWSIEDEVDPRDPSKLVTPIKYTCKVELDSTIPSEKAIISTYNDVILCGDTTIKNVILKVDYGADIVFDGYNFVFEEGSEVEARRVCLLDDSASGLDKDVNVVIKGSFLSNYILLGAGKTNHTLNGDINFFIDNPKARAVFKFRSGDTVADPFVFTGTEATGANVYNGDIKIVVKKAEALNFKYIENSAIVNGDLQMIVDGDIEAPYSFKENFNKIAVNGGKWLVINKATTDDFVTFGDQNGKFTVNTPLTVYSRKDNQEVVTHTGGVLDFSAISGVYTVSNKMIDEVSENPHKMLYFSCSGGTHRIVTYSHVIPGETYCYELSIYCNSIEDVQLFSGMGDNGDVGMGAQFEVISKEKIGNYYRFKGQITIPKAYPLNAVQIGVFLPGYAEGVLFDRTFYKKDDASKTDLTFENRDFTSGLDGIRFNYVFWGTRYHTQKGGEALLSWNGSIRSLKIMDFDEAYIAELIKLAKPNDGKWWDDKDIIEKKTVITYAKANGVFKDSDGKPIKNTKFLLASSDKNYTATTNSKGKFNFGKVRTGYYELFVMDGKKKLDIGFTAFLNEDDVITFDVVSDISELKEAVDNSANDYDSVIGGESTEEIEATGNLSGTVFTPYLETVENLKIYLKGVGEVVTDENGSFAFANVPVGEYELYTVLADDSEYLFRKVSIGENQNLAVKLKYDPPIKTDSDNANNGWIIWVIIAAVVALVSVAGIIGFKAFKKKKLNK